jgi:hypothetical protein
MPFNWDNIKNIDFNMVSPHWIFDIQKDLDGEKINYNIGYVDDNGILRLNQMSVHQLQTTGLTKLGKQVFIGDVDGETDICNSQLTVMGTIVAKKIFIDEPSEIAGIHKITGQVLACNTESMDYLATSNEIEGVLEQYKKGWGSIFVENCIGLFSLFEPHPLLIQRELSLNTIEKKTQNQDQIHNRIHIKGFRDHKTSINIDTMWKTLPIIRFQEYLYLNDAGKNNMVDDDVEPRLIPLGNNGLRKYPRGGGKPRYDVQWLMGSIDSKFTITVASNYEGDDLFETDLNKNKKALFPENENLVLKQGLEIIPYDDDVVDASTELVFRYRCREIDLNKGNMTFRNKIFGVMPGVDDAAILLDVSGGIVDCKYMETQQAYVSRDLLVGGGVEITNAGLDENGEVNKTTIGGPLRADKYFRLKGDLLLQWGESVIGFEKGLEDTNDGWLYKLTKLGLRMKALQTFGGDKTAVVKNLYSQDEIRLNNVKNVIKGCHINLTEDDSGFLIGNANAEPGTSSSIKQRVLVTRPVYNNDGTIKTEAVYKEQDMDGPLGPGYKGFVFYGDPMKQGIEVASISAQHKFHRTQSDGNAITRFLFCNETAFVANVNEKKGLAILVQGNQVIESMLKVDEGIFVLKGNGIGCVRTSARNECFNGKPETRANHIIFDNEKHTKMTYETEFLGEEGSWGIMARNPIYVSGSKSRGISRWVGLDYGYSYEVWDDGASASSSKGDRVLGRTDVTDIYGILRKSGGTSVAMSIEATKAIYSHYGVYSSSDKRIKGAIENVPDDWALNVVNNIETKFYLYKNRYNDPDYKTIGFIAQEVREHFPQAVTLRKNYIPVDSVKFLSNMIWNQHKDLWYVKCDELKDISGVKYKLNCFNKKIEFYFDNPNEELIYDEIEVIGNYNNEFVFPKKYVDIFVAGREIDDFHTVAKEKIFTLHHSAIQELSKKNNILEDKVTSLKSELDIMKEKIERLEQLLI